MSQHLNYCRQMVKQFSAQIAVPSLDPSMRQYMSHCIDLAKASQKFILPDGGRLYDDPDYRALDESAPLSLPYEFISIEFTRSDGYVGNHPFANGEQGVVQPRKALMFARQRDTYIAVTVLPWAEHMGMWTPYPEVAIPRVGYIDRSLRRNGYAGVKLAQNPNAFMKVPGTDYMDEIGALLCMLNVLSCANVRVEKSSQGSTRKAMSKRGALQFDDYHILTIDAPATDKGVSAGTSGSSRSPREHLRRGHIRRYENGLKVWVNATVVNHGVGGKVAKDYRIAAHA